MESHVKNLAKGNLRCIRRKGLPGRPALLFEG
jgi:hypothetical protein